MNNCYSCGVLFNGFNNSFEHVINNSIGGRWRNRWLLCKECNEEFGGRIDRVLDKQLGMLTDHLGIIRHREKDNIALPMKGADGSLKMVAKQLKPLARLTTKFPDRDDVVENVPEEELQKRMTEKKAELSRKYKIIEEIDLFSCFVTDICFFWYLFVTQSTDCFSVFNSGKIIVTI